MSRRLQENLVSLLLLCVFGGAWYLAQDFGPRARLIPVPLAVLGILLTLIQLGWHNVGRNRMLQMDMIHVDTSAFHVAEGTPREEKTREQLARWGEAGALAVVALLVLLIFTIGIFPAVMAFTTGYFWLTRYCTPALAVACAAALTLAVYLLFVVALEIQPYHGLLSRWIT